jgi:hypothetical protein
VIQVINKNLAKAGLHTVVPFFVWHYLGAPLRATHVRCIFRHKLRDAEVPLSDDHLQHGLRNQNSSKSLPQSPIRCGDNLILTVTGAAPGPDRRRVALFPLPCWCDRFPLASCAAVMGNLLWTVVWRSEPASRWTRTMSLSVCRMLRRPTANATRLPSSRPGIGPKPAAQAFGGQLADLLQNGPLLRSCYWESCRLPVHKRCLALTTARCDGGSLAGQ